MYCLLLILANGVLTSCSSDDSVEVVGLEVTGSGGFDGIYMLDETFTEGTKYVKESDDNTCIKTINIDDEDLWILLQGGYYYYKIAQDGPYPPESDWVCGFDYDMDTFRCTIITK